MFSYFDGNSDLVYDNDKLKVICVLIKNISSSDVILNMGNYYLLFCDNDWSDVFIKLIELCFC